MSLIKDLMLGFAVGDALGVPAENSSTEALKKEPVTGMREHGTHDMPRGTWSDDTSLCLAFMSSYAMEHGQISMFRIMREYSDYYANGKYTPHGRSFSVGRTCKRAIEKFMQGTPCISCGCGQENDCGNGALMRLAPLVPILKYVCTDDDLRYSFIGEFTALTHNHKRCIACSLVYCFAALELIGCQDKKRAAVLGVHKAKLLMESKGGYEKELNELNRIFSGIDSLPEDKIGSTGYVIDTLEAALWCLLNTDSYKDCVLLAVNLGGDTDTTAAVAGSLAGIVYGADSIEKDWTDSLVRKDLILKITDDFKNALELKANTDF